MNQPAEFNPEQPSYSFTQRNLTALSLTLDSLCPEGWTLKKVGAAYRLTTTNGSQFEALSIVTIVEEVREQVLSPEPVNCPEFFYPDCYEIQSGIGHPDFYVIRYEDKVQEVFFTYEQAQAKLLKYKALAQLTYDSYQAWYALYGQDE